MDCQGWRGIDGEAGAASGAMSCCVGWDWLCPGCQEHLRGAMRRAVAHGVRLSERFNRECAAASGAGFVDRADYVEAQAAAIESGEVEP